MPRDCFTKKKMDLFEKRISARGMFRKYSDKEIALFLEVPESVVSYWRKDYEQSKKSRGASTAKERKCISCGRTFSSSGPENRICPLCKEKDIFKIPDYMILGA